MLTTWSLPGIVTSKVALLVLSPFSATQEYPPLARPPTLHISSLECTKRTSPVTVTWLSILVAVSNPQEGDGERKCPFCDQLIMGDGRPWAIHVSTTVWLDERLTSSGATRICVGAVCVGGGEYNYCKLSKMDRQLRTLVWAGGGGIVKMIVQLGTPLPL